MPSSAGERRRNLPEPRAQRAPLTRSGYACDRARVASRAHEGLQSSAFAWTYGVEDIRGLVCNIEGQRQIPACRAQQLMAQRFEACIKDPQGNAVDVQFEVRPPLLPCGCPSPAPVCNGR